VQLISAVIRPSKAAEVAEALQVYGFHGLTVTEASGFGKHRGPTEIYRGAEYNSGFSPRLKVEIVVPDEDVADLVSIICRAATTGAPGGDGKLWVTPVSVFLRIRTREAGIAAL
jgi:nitrogen regulatory protein PII